MMLTGAILLGYMGLVLTVGWMVRRKASTTPTDYYLAGRGLSGLVLLGTMAATNFSAFTVFGVSGAGYRDGLAFLPIMALGTGFMALNFRLLGCRIRALGETHGLTTPGDLVERVYGGRVLARLFSTVMVLFTVPYVALQPLAAGALLETLLGWKPWLGAGLVTAVMVVYTLRGGMRAVAWTDVVQGLLMVGAMAAAVAVLGVKLGGPVEALREAEAAWPEHFSRPGPGGRYSLGVWTGFMVLWFCSDPMFPQLFQRFYAARDDKALQKTMVFYPGVCLVIFAMPVVLGVWGRLVEPMMSATAADGIVGVLMQEYGGPILGTVVMAAGLAALMSTMDSQLLTLTSMITRDWTGGGAWTVRRRWGEKAVIVGLGAAGWAVAVFTDTTILALGLTAFTGLAVLYPTVLGGLILKRPCKAAGWVSIVAGEATAVLFHFKVLEAGAMLPAVVAIGVSAAGYMITHLLVRRSLASEADVRGGRWVVFFGALFAAAQDGWWWNRSEPLWWGLPFWVWYAAGLVVVLTAGMWAWGREGARGKKA